MTFSLHEHNHRMYFECLAKVHGRDQGWEWIEVIGRRKWVTMEGYAGPDWKGPECHTQDKVWGLLYSQGGEP